MPRRHSSTHRRTVSLRPRQWWAHRLKPNVETTGRRRRDQGSHEYCCAPQTLLHTKKPYEARKRHECAGDHQSVPTTPATAVAVYANWVTARDLCGQRRREMFRRLHEAGSARSSTDRPGHEHHQGSRSTLRSMRHFSFDQSDP